MAVEHEITVASVFMPRLMLELHDVIPQPWKMVTVDGVTGDYLIVNEADMGASVLAAIDAAVAAHDPTPYTAISSCLPICVKSDLAENTNTENRALFCYVSDVDAAGCLAILCPDGKWRKIALGEELDAP